MHVTSFNAWHGECVRREAARAEAGAHADRGRGAVADALVARRPPPGQHRRVLVRTRRDLQSELRDQASLVQVLYIHNKRADTHQRLQDRAHRFAQQGHARAQS